MGPNSHLKLLYKLAFDKPLTNFVAQALNAKTENKTPDVKLDPNNKNKSGAFKEQYLKLPPGPAREKLVYDAVIAQGKPVNLVPVKVALPNGGFVEYKVTPDWLMVDGIRVMLSGQTAQKIADHFNMVLPTRNMSKQIYNAADGKAFVTPFSASGFTDANGKYWDAKQFCLNKIGDSDSSVQFNQNVDKAFQGKDVKLKAGFMKDITQPAIDDKLGLYGLFFKEKPIQDTISSPHDTKFHGEYASGARMIDSKIKIINPDGSIKEIPMDDALKNPDIAKTIADPGANGIRRYKLNS